MLSLPRLTPVWRPKGQKMTEKDAVGDGILHPRCRNRRPWPNITSQHRLTSDWCRHLTNWTKHVHVVFDSGYSRHYTNTWRHPQNRKYTTYRIAVRGGPIESRPRPHVTNAENLVKFGHVIFEICERRDKTTDIGLQTCCSVMHNTSYPYCEQSNYVGNGSGLQKSMNVIYPK